MVSTDGHAIFNLCLLFVYISDFFSLIVTGLLLLLLFLLLLLLLLFLLDNNINIFQAPMVVGNRKRLWMVSALFTVFLNLHYTFLIYYTQVFRSYSSNGSAAGVVEPTLIKLFAIYVIICTLFRVFLKRLGMECDRMKMNTASLFFVTEFICLMFYYVFYRVLFEAIPNWGTFFVLEICHLAFEWICYPLRARVSESCKGYFGERIITYLFSPCGLDISDWQKFISLDFGIRCFVIIGTGVSFTVSTLSVSFMPWIHNGLAQQGNSLLFTMAICGVSIMMEILNAYFIDVAFFRKKNLKILTVVLDCYQDNRFAFITVVLGASLIMNPIYAFTEDNSF